MDRTGKIVSAPFFCNTKNIYIFNYIVYSLGPS